MIDLFTYPTVAGHKGPYDTGRQAAEKIDAKSLRVKTLAALGQWGPLTADEIAARLHIDKLSIRPRCSELAALDLIEDSGQRRENSSGRRAVVWQAIAQRLAA